MRAKIVIDTDWARLLTQPATAQYLPMGEILGSIPGSKPSGAWARVIGLALASFWRRQPRAALDGSIRPTRRELLERYAPKTGMVAEVFDGPNPQYATDYWCVALQILAIPSCSEWPHCRPRLRPKSDSADRAKRRLDTSLNSIWFDNKLWEFTLKMPLITMTNGLFAPEAQGRILSSDESNATSINEGPPRRKKTRCGFT